MIDIISNDHTHLKRQRSTRTKRLEILKRYSKANGQAWNDARKRRMCELSTMSEGEINRIREKEDHTAEPIRYAWDYPYTEAWLQNLFQIIYLLDKLNHLDKNYFTKIEKNGRFIFDAMDCQSKKKKTQNLRLFIIQDMDPKQKK